MIIVHSFDDLFILFKYAFMACELFNINVHSVDHVHFGIDDVVTAELVMPVSVNLALKNFQAIFRQVSVKTLD